MSTNFSATPSALGYLYQVLYSLYALLESEEETELSIERLDDIALEQNGTPKELLQLKHHIGVSTPSITDKNVDFWKTIRVWSSSIKKKQIDPSRVILSLITTGKISDTSLASLLRPGRDRDPQKAMDKMIEIANNPGNASLKPAFAEFLSLSTNDMLQMITSIQIIENSPDIQQASRLIKRRIDTAVSKEKMNALYERLEGWWFSRVINHLNDQQNDIIQRFEVMLKIRDIADQFHPESLPIDFIDKEPPTVIDPENDERIFVMQLRYLGLPLLLLEKAIIDYYRAFEQRAKWAREDLLIGDEVEKYEKKLIDEWQRIAASLESDLDKDASEEMLAKCGREIFKSINLSMNIKIRPRVDEPYIMRGSYHILANADNPRVWWHPKFIEKLGDILLTKEE